jgi:hypothetical protein
MSSTIHTNALPSAIQQKLSAVRRRGILIAATRAFAVGGAVLLMAMIVAMSIDWIFTLFDPVIRTALTIATFSVAAVVCTVVAARPICRALRWSYAARIVDAAVPQLQQRWTTVASFARSYSASASSTTNSMLDQVTREAVAMHSLVRPNQIVSTSTIRPAFFKLAGSSFAMAVFLVLQWEQTSILLRRFLSPMQNITATQLSSITGDRSVPRGETIELVTTQSGMRRSSAELVIEFPSGAQETVNIPAHQDSPDTFSLMMRVDGSLRYRVRAGDGQTQWHWLEAINYPEIVETRFKLSAPEYVDRPVVEKELIPRQVKVIAGTHLALAIKSKEPLKRLAITLTKPAASRLDQEVDQQEVELIPDADGWYEFNSYLFEDVTLQPKLLSRNGLTDEGRSFCKIQVVADQAPIARVIRPTDETAVSPDDVLEIEFEAHDDHGIATAELVIYDDSVMDEDGQPKVIATKPIPLGDQYLQKHVTGKTQFDLKELGLNSGDSISYAIRVTDNRDISFGEQSSDSEVALTSPAENMLRSGEENAQRSDQENPATSEGPSSIAQQNASSPSELPVGESTNATVMNGVDGESTAVAESETLAASDTAVASALELHQTDGESNRRDGESPQTESESTGDSVAATARKSADATSKQDEKSASEESGKSAASIDPILEPTGEAATAAAREDLPELEQREKEMIAANEKSDAPGLSPSVSSPPDRDTSPVNEAKPEANPPLASAMVALTPQLGQSGQNAETSRRRLKIAARLTSTPVPRDRSSKKDEIRDRVVAVDLMLAESETALKALVDHTIADSQRGEELKGIDTQFGAVEKYGADLRAETRENVYAFVGLQIVDIIRTHVTPARDRVFVATRNPNASDVDVKVALGRVQRARDLLGALLVRYDRVNQDRELNESLEESITMYEVYVEKRLELMREARQNRNPLTRKMGVIEVDQDYLDRYAEVERLRQEMIEEFGRMLGDDPRLLSRYLDLVKRRERSLRDRLTELGERQHEAALELSSWLEIDQEQKDALWSIIQELRLHAAAQLAKDAAELAERTEKQMPLEADTKGGTPAALLRLSGEIAERARSIAIDADQRLAGIEPDADLADFARQSEELVAMFARLDATFDRLQFEHEELEFADFVQARLLDSRAVGEQAEAWAILVNDLGRQSYESIVSIDQQRMAAETQLLRTEMLNFESGLEAQFQREARVALPDEIAALVHQLHQTMEAITFSQLAASYAAGNQDLLRAAQQQQVAVDRFERAEKLFDQIRRTVADALDAYDVDNPNIADLRDPTLDEFLARLERQPSVAAQLGIPGRPRNLRPLSDAMLSQQSDGGLLASSAEAAMSRARGNMKDGGRGGNESEPASHEDSKQTAEERRQIAEAKEAQELLEKALLSIEEQLNDEETPVGRRQQLDRVAASLKQIIEQSQEDSSGRQAWQQLAQTDLVKAIMAALGRGEAIPDQQWNKLLSSLEEGLWQVRGKKPPEEYRKAIEQYQNRIRELVGSIDDV